MSAGPPGPLADGRYRDIATDRWPRVGLTCLAAVTLASVVVIGGDALTLGLVLGAAVSALLLRVLLLRPRLEVSDRGLRLVGLLRARRVPWAAVAGAGARPVPGPLGRVEQCLLVYVRQPGAPGTRARRVRVVRGGVDPATGVAAAVAEMAAALVARAEREQGGDPAGSGVVAPRARR